MKRTSPTFFAMQVNEHLSIPTEFKHGTVASGIFGCEREYYGDGERECSPMCVKDGCRKSVWVMNSNGTNMKCIHESKGHTAHIYAPSSVKKPIRTLDNNLEMIDMLKEAGVTRVEVYRMAFSMSEYRGSMDVETGDYLGSRKIVMRSSISEDRVRMKSGDSECDDSRRSSNHSDRHRGHDNKDDQPFIMKHLGKVALILVILVILFIVVWFLFNDWSFKSIDSESTMFESWCKWW